MSTKHWIPLIAAAGLVCCATACLSEHHTPATQGAADVGGGGGEHDAAQPPGRDAGPPAARDVGLSSDLRPQADLGAIDVGGDPDVAIPWVPPPPECPARSLFCGQVEAGCWPYPEPEGCPDCPLTGCDSGIASPVGVVLVWDVCQGARVHLVGGSPSLWADAVGTDHGPRMDVRFDLRHGQETLSACAAVALPTGAERFGVRCYDGDEWVSAAVLEPNEGGACPACPDVSGCYRVRGDAELPLLPFAPRPDEATIYLEQRGCSLQLGGPDPANPVTVTGSVEPDGTLSFVIAEIVGHVNWMACHGLARDGAYRTLSCRLFDEDGQVGDPFPAELERTDAAECGR